MANTGNTWKFHPEIAHNIMLSACQANKLPVAVVSEPLKQVLFQLYQQGFFLGGHLQSPVVSGIVNKLVTHNVPAGGPVQVQAPTQQQVAQAAPVTGVVINTSPAAVPMNAPVMPTDQPASI